MGCCNKDHHGKPISRVRYATGLAIFLGAQGVTGTFLSLGSLVSRRCRNVRRFHRAWAGDRLRSIVRRDGFRVGAAGDACDGGGAA